MVQQGGYIMTHREIIHVLMLSPIYFKLSLTDRKQLIEEYCILFDKVCAKINAPKSKEENSAFAQS